MDRQTTPARVAVEWEPRQPPPLLAGWQGADGDSGQALIFNFILLPPTPPPPPPPPISTASSHGTECVCAECAAVWRGAGHAGLRPALLARHLHRPTHQPRHTHCPTARHRSTKQHTVSHTTHTIQMCDARVSKTIHTKAVTTSIHHTDPHSNPGNSCHTQHPALMSK